ncbi:MAG: hypothetical protein ACOCV1_02460, partial [Bacillota bacterium]
MLIRTSPNQVEKTYKDFLDNYSKPKNLKESELEEVKKTINNLGLTWRANILKKMAKYLIDNNIHEEERLTIEELKNIPGVGDYIANAVLTFYYEKRAILIDSNTKRFFKRYYKDIYDEGLKKNVLKKRMDKIVPENNKDAVKFNIAFLDFMRKVCKPTN